MMNSRNSSSQRATERRGARREKGAPGTTDLDRSLKLASARALASAGAYVRTNVILSEPKEPDARSAKWVADVTDIDVLAVTHTVDLSSEISCMSCKAGTRVAVIHETFALAGVMQYLHARRGYAVFEQKTIESHMAGLGQQLSVAVMDRPEWNHWIQRVAGSFPVPRMLEEDIDAAVSAQLDKRTDLEGLLRYLKSEFWFYRDYRNVQSMVAHLRRAAKTLNDAPLSQFVILDAASLFALAILQLCEHVSTAGVLKIREIAPPYLFGGIPTYRNRRDLLRKVEELLRRKGVLDPDQGLPALDPAYLGDLLELVLRWCNKPNAAARVPQYLNLRAGHAAAMTAGDSSSGTAHGESDVTEKLAFDLLEFLAVAARFKPEVSTALLGASTGSKRKSSSGSRGNADESDSSLGETGAESPAAFTQTELLDDRPSGKNS